MSLLHALDIGNDKIIQKWNLNQKGLDKLFKVGGANKFRTMKLANVLDIL